MANIKLDKDEAPSKVIRYLSLVLKTQLHNMKTEAVRVHVWTEI